MHSATVRGPASTRPRALWTVAAVLAATAAVASPAFAAPARRAAPSPPTVLHIALQSRQVYTSTGVTLRAGDSVSISASGQIRFGGGKIAAMTPPGIPRGPECDAIARSQPRANPWPAPKEACWSLIAKVGAGVPIEVGEAKSFRAANPGLLRLGLNDNFVDDNTGRWLAIVSVTRGPTTPTSPGTASTGATKTSDTLVFVLIGLAVLLLLLALAWSRQRTKKRRAAAELSTATEPADPALVEAFAPLLAESGAEAMVAAAPVSAPPETDSIDVNIFEVEFSNGLTLRVGYNHFPEGTELRWRVTQNRFQAASGSFVAKGGGSTSHVETVPLGVKLEGRQTQPDGADVQFDWSINGVPFRYSVRRDTNC